MTTNSVLKLIILLVVVLAGWIGTQLFGFQFAPDAGNTFLTSKLPVFFLVALLIERTAEIFLTIWRGGDSENLQKQLDSLTALRKKEPTRSARLKALPGDMSACATEIGKLNGVAGKEAELKAQQEKMAALETETNELTDADKQFKELLKNGTVEKRTEALADRKNTTRSFAFVFNFILALCVAGCGFRAVEGLVILRPSDPEERVVVPAFDKERLEKLTKDLTAKVIKDRDRLEAVKEKEKRETTKEKQDKDLALWLEKDLENLLVDASLQNQILWFRFLDILLTAGLLAGGADPISRMMRLLRVVLDESRKRAEKKGTD